MQSINPATEELFEEYPETAHESVDLRLQMAHEAQLSWRKTSFDARVSRLRSLGKLLRAEVDSLADLATNEMGKPIAQSRGEVEKCAWVCDYYAEHAEEFLEPRTEPVEGGRGYVRYDPLGVVLAVMPWNFPYWQVFRAAVPAVAAGNVMALKHASNVSGVSQEIERLFVRADFPAGVFTSLLLSSERTEKLLGDPRIRAVTLTGSERAGKSVAAAAGRELKPSVLELGGSDPFIVLADADVGAVVSQAVQARTQNTGQSCIAAKRFLVEQPILKEFEAAFVDAMSALKVGDPLDEANDLGPLARSDLRETLHDQVSRSCEQGAELLLGGSEPEGTGYYYPPTVLTNVKPGMAAFDEETFGPAAAIVPVGDRTEAIELANQSSFGLGASVWSSDVDAAEALAGQIEAGCVFINSIVKSDPHLPFGGIKRSGYGRELSREGIREFVNVKSVWVDSV
ncbi:MAG: NAD-dependent succinate-semialdehyde dehydrogenase [Planctomycetota bacterium]|nr:MAG: NAD-dependent succinate-semialdehyde dehydrogenase [Planctomycetota bacterium]REK20453.1 MAG: NAD-dependent succinate-semialdehyde dehydrogenase [Planctomycetota bacterium]REK29292.1 MAG: NAD-dependent succinate-semialdehyde dehydrogenase [Planctomycetota bacterium]